MEQTDDHNPLLIAKGSKNFTWLDVTLRLDGSMLRVPMHVVSGAESGPTLTLTAGLHGSEWLPVEIFRRLVTDLDPAELKGRLVVIPVANPEAFKSLTRNTPDESDEPDLNRVFPGGDTWQTVQIAREITRHVLPQTNYLIDFHMGIWGSTMGEVSYGQDHVDKEMVKRAAEVARAFGYPLIRRLNALAAFPGPRSITAYSAAHFGIPAIGASIGGTGFAPELEEQWVQINLTGIQNVMKHVGMLAGTPAIPERFLTFSGRGHRVVPSVGGYLDPVVPADALLQEVQKGDLLGRVFSPYTFEVLEELRSPVRGILFETARPYPVWPGDWAFFVADLEDESTYWIDGSA